MTIEERVDKLGRALGKNDDLVRELRDAVTVTAGLEARHGQMMKDHAEWLIGHDQALLEHREQMKLLDTRLANLVSGIGEFMQHRAK